MRRFSALLIAVSCGGRPAAGVRDLQTVVAEPVDVQLPAPPRAICSVRAVPTSRRSAYDELAPSDCGKRLTLFADPSCRQPISRVRLTPANDLAAGFSPGARSAFVRVSADGVSTQGFVAFGAIELRVARDVRLLAGHVTLRTAAHAEVTSFDEHGAHLAVHDDLVNIVDLDVLVACADLVYDPKMDDEPADGAPSRSMRAGELHLAADAGGPMIALVRTSRPNEVGLTVTERRGNELHVTLSTPSFEIKGWVDVVETAEAGAVAGSRLPAWCGGVVDDMNRSCVAPTADVDAFVAKSPSGRAQTGMHVRRGRSLVETHRVAGYSAVYARFAGIEPASDDEEFWVPTNELESCREASRPP